MYLGLFEEGDYFGDLGGERRLLRTLRVLFGGAPLPQVRCLVLQADLLVFFKFGCLADVEGLFAAPSALLIAFFIIEFPIVGILRLIETTVCHLNIFLVGLKVFQLVPKLRLLSRLSVPTLPFEFVEPFVRVSRGLRLREEVLVGIAATIDFQCPLLRAQREIFFFLFLLQLLDLRQS